ncbi:hypothetical protein [Planctomycetes bacterium K23_9]|uniref:Uncharacterized protein n=1 Tax=Stieleria marina TaxID=1930275 RepID=A0A517NZB7_9BACT|nr:hypothetical protein K239x_44710 [Planctomycetes bacterium K23_9]
MFFVRPILLCLFVVVSVSAKAESPLESITLSDVIAGLQKNESDLQTLGVTYRCKGVQNFFGDFAKNGARQTFAEQWQVNASGYGWNDAKGDITRNRPDGSVRDHSFHHRACFDGKEGRTLTEETRGLGQPTLRGNIELTLMRYAVSPFDLTTQHQGQPISEHLSKGGQIVGSESWDGHQVTVVESVTDANVDTFKSQYWIDPERGFAVVRRRNLMRSTPQSEWKVVYSIDSFKLSKNEDGFWFPQIAWVQTFGVAGHGADVGATLRRSDLRCEKWIANADIDKKRMQIDFPSGLDVPALRRNFTDVAKAASFYVQPIETDLQRELIGSSKSDTYAHVDVTAYANVNTKQIDPARFDFDALGIAFKAASDRRGNKHANLFVAFEHGALGSDSTLAAFVRLPVIQLAKDNGFASVKHSSRYGGSLWQPLPEPFNAESDERNLGDDQIGVYLVGSRLGRALADDFECLIVSKSDRPLKPKQLISDGTLQKIQAAVKGVDVAGKSLRLSLTLGGPRDNPAKANELAGVMKDSPVQVNAIKALRKIGFGNIRLSVKVGFTIYVSDYIE